jgi:hypothetical protein
MNKKKKLTLGSERIASLGKEKMSNVLGGLAQGSTNHNFTCGLCTGGDQPPIQDYPSDATYTCTVGYTIC